MPILARWPLASAMALVAGVCWGLCFGREPLLILPWVALAGYFAVVWGSRQPVRLAWLHGIATWGTAMSWMVPTLVTYGQIPKPLALVLMVGLAAWLGSFHALAAWLIAPLARLRPAPAIIGGAASWVVVEWFRGWSFSGFPWNLAAYAAIDTPGALALSSWLGPWGVSFLVAGSGAGCALAWARRDWRLAGAVALVPLLVLPLAGRLALAEEPQQSLGDPIEVRIVQPNISNLVGWDPVAVERNYRNVMALTAEACDRPGALVIWPESAAWPFRIGADPHFDQDLAGVLARGCSILVNSATLEGEAWYNSVWRLAPGQVPARADKRHLVPFGEYVPFGELIPFVGRLARNAGDFSPARAITLLPVEGENLGVAVCYEIVFPGEVAQLVGAGATVLVTVTNDAWYGDTAAPWQHFAAARFRAAELRRPVLRAAITGVSASIDPHGRVVQSLGVEERGVISTAVWGRLDQTPAARWPWLGPVLAAAITLLASALARRR